MGMRRGRGNEEGASGKREKKTVGFGRPCVEMGIYLVSPFSSVTVVGEYLTCVENV